LKNFLRRSILRVGCKATEPDPLRSPFSTSRGFYSAAHGIGVENGYVQLVIEMEWSGCCSGSSLERGSFPPGNCQQTARSPWFHWLFVIFCSFHALFPIGYATLSFYQDFLVNAYFLY